MRVQSKHSAVHRRPQSPCCGLVSIVPVFFFLPLVGVSVDMCYTAPCKLVHPRLSNNTADFGFHMWKWFRCAPVCRRSHPQQSRKVLLVKSSSHALAGKSVLDVYTSVKHAWEISGGLKHGFKKNALHASPNQLCAVTSVKENALSDLGDMSHWTRGLRNQGISFRLRSGSCPFPLHVIFWKSQWLQTEEQEKISPDGCRWLKHILT